jgi:hypothetical protein
VRRAAAVCLDAVALERQSHRLLGLLGGDAEMAGHLMQRHPLRGVGARGPSAVRSLMASQSRSARSAFGRVGFGIASSVTDAVDGWGEFDRSRRVNNDSNL